MSKQNNAEKKKITICLILAFLLLLLLIFINTPEFPKIFSNSNSIPNSEVGNKAEIDITPPIVKCDIKNKTLISGDTISVEKLGLKIYDSSEIESTMFTKISSTNFYTGLTGENDEIITAAYRDGIPIETKELQFSYSGIYTLTMRVRDVFYNTSELELTVKVEEPPIIEINEHFYVADIKDIDFRKYMNAWDFISEDLDISDVEIDSSQLKLSTQGTYPVTLSATDDYGLITTKTIYVHVSSQESLQELINTHAIDLNTSTILGAKNAYDSGYYQAKDAEFIQNVMQPTIVDIENDSNGITGNGFIIEISDSFITIATNEHIIANDLESNITFFDGTKCNGAVVAANAEKDIAFVRIPIKEMENNTESALSSKYVNKLRTVHINQAHWETNNTTQTMISSTDFTDGAPIFDLEGRLIGMIRYATTHTQPEENVTIPLSELLNYFEVVFKYKIQYI